MIYKLQSKYKFNINKSLKDFLTLIQNIIFKYYY